MAGDALLSANFKMALSAKSWLKPFETFPDYYLAFSFYFKLPFGLERVTSSNARI